MWLNNFSFKQFWRMSAMRLTLIFSFVFVLILVASNYVAYEMMWNEVASHMQKSLSKRYQDYEKILAENGDDLSQIYIHQDDFVAFRSKLNVNEKQFDRLGYFVLDEEDLEALKINHQTHIKNAESWYFLAKKHGDDVLIVGQDLTLVVEIIGESHQSSIKFAAFALCLSFALGVIMGIKNNRRLVQISNILGKVADGDFKARLNRAKKQDDIDLLMHQIDDILERLERQFLQTKLLSSNIAHELKTPLSRLYIQMEQARLKEDPAEISNLVETSEIEIKKMLKIFDSMIRIAKLESGEGRQNLSKQSLKSVIDEVNDTYEPVLEDQNIELHYDMVQDATIEMDEALIFQALVNLIENSLKHGQNLQNIWLKLDGRSLSYWDDGGGVPDVHLSKLTDPLFQGDSSRNKGGAGLGLSLIAAICQYHKASLLIKNNEKPSGLLLNILF